MSGMHEKERRSTVRRADDVSHPLTVETAVGAPARPSTTLWRMRSAIRDNQASCSVSDTGEGCAVLVVFSKGLGVPEYFSDVGAALRHSREIAGRLVAQGWVEIDLRDE